MNPISRLRIAAYSLVFSLDISLPSSMYVPSDMLSINPIILRSVLLPHPDLPCIATNSPSSIATSNPLNITFSVNPLSYFFTKFSIFIIYSCSVKITLGKLPFIFIKTVKILIAIIMRTHAKDIIKVQ